jgi:hypothetical protein
MRLSFLKKKRILIPFVAFLLLVMLGGYVARTQAQFAGPLAPFAGKIVAYRWCSGNNVLLVTVAGPMGGEFTYIPGTQAYESFNIGANTGIWVLGLYLLNEAICYDSDFDRVGSPSGTITPTVGTSPAF